MFNKRGLGRIHRKENSFNQDQINLAPLLANQVSLIVQVIYIDLLKSWFHWKKATTLYRLWSNQSWFRQTSTPPPPYYYSPTKKVFGFARISWVVPGGVGGARAPPPWLRHWLYHRDSIRYTIQISLVCVHCTSIDYYIQHTAGVSSKQSRWKNLVFKV